MGGRGGREEVSGEEGLICFCLGEGGGGKRIAIGRRATEGESVLGEARRAMMSSGVASVSTRSQNSSAGGGLGEVVEGSAGRVVSIEGSTGRVVSIN